MGQKRKGQLSKTPAFASWWKHLRPYNKRKFAKGERQAAKKEIKNCS
jgi:hypothetical protein